MHVNTLDNSRPHPKCFFSKADTAIQKTDKLWTMQGFKAEEEGANSQNPSSYNKGFSEDRSCEEMDDRLTWNLLGSKYKDMSENQR